MQSSTKFVLVTGAVALVGSVAIAATIPAAHQLTVALPNGGVEQISYTGDAAPKIKILPASVQVEAGMPVAGFEAPFTGFDQISAQIDEMAADMDRQMAIAIRDMDDAPLAKPDGFTSATLRDLPVGTENYFMVSTMAGANTCVREVQITSRGDGVRPEVVSHTSGDCGAENSSGPVFGGSPVSSSPVNGQLIKAKTPLAAQATAGHQHI